MLSLDEKNKIKHSVLSFLDHEYDYAIVTNAVITIESVIFYYSGVETSTRRIK